MSTRAAVQVLERGMSAPRGVRFSATALLFDETTEATFIEAGAWLQRIEGCRAWWWGDYMVAYCAWKITQDIAANKLTNDPESTEKARTTYTTQYAEAAGVHPETLRDWKGVAEFYATGCRHPVLSFAHHHEARAGGDLPLALQWLARAHREGWGKTDLRAAIREARTAATSKIEPLPPARMQELYSFTRWARTYIVRVHAMDTSEAANLRSEMEPAAKLLHALDEKIAAASKGGRKN